MFWDLLSVSLLRFECMLFTVIEFLFPGVELQYRAGQCAAWAGRLF